MADPQKDQRTEAPTAKRRRDFKRDGRVAKSQDVPAAMSLLAAVLLILVFGPMLVEPVVSGMKSFIRTAPQGFDSPAFRTDLPRMIILTLAPVLAVTVTMGVVGNVAQTGFVLSPGAAKPKWSKLSLKNGASKLAPKRMLWETARLVLKLTLLFAVVIGPIQVFMGDVNSIRGLDSWLSLTYDSIRSVLLRSAGLALVIAAGDYAYHRRTLMGQMKMTREETKRESKDQDGDPLIRQQRKNRQREMSRNRMIATVADADVVLLNPVRLAIALKYDDGEPAPRVVAKGAGPRARKLRREAYRHGVPVRQDKPLARALYRRCRVGDYIPAELFEAVAAVLAAVIRTRRRAQVG